MKRLATTLLAMALLLCCLPVRLAAGDAGNITLGSARKTLYTGEQLLLTPRAEQTGAAIKVHWATSNKRVASVSAKGLVTALAAGTAKITATPAAGKAAKATIVIRVRHGVKNKSIALNRRAHTMAAGDGFRLSVARWRPANTKVKKLRWASDDEAVARVSKKGYVTAVAPGVAKITATNSYGKKAVCTLTVTVAAQPSPPDSEAPPKKQPVSFPVTNEAGKRLAGISCTLGGATARSGGDGIVTFSAVAPGAHTLRIGGHDEWEEARHSLTVAESGVTVDRMSLASFSARLKTIRKDFSLDLRDPEGVLLYGETFGLYASGTQALYTAQTVSGGPEKLCFSGVATGSYTLKQVAAQPGYKPYLPQHSVTVSKSGVRVDGIPAERFSLSYEYRSAQPLVDDILPGAGSISGQGMSGSTIEVKVSTGNNTAASYYGTVQPNGQWTVEVPGQYITNNSYLSVRQTETGFLQSRLVRKQVLEPRYRIAPVVVNKATGAPIAGIRLEVHTPGVSVPMYLDSAGDGTCPFDTTPGTYLIRCTSFPAAYSGCEADGKTLTVRPDGSMLLDNAPFTNRLVIAMIPAA